MIEIKEGHDKIARRIINKANALGYRDQKQLAKDLFGDESKGSYLTDILVQGRRRTIDNMIQIAKTLNCSLDYLYGLSDIDDVNVHLSIGSSLGLEDESIMNVQDLDKQEKFVLNQLLSSFGFCDFLHSFFNLFKVDIYSIDSESLMVLNHYLEGRVPEIVLSDLERILSIRVFDEIKNIVNLSPYKYETSKKKYDEMLPKFKELEQSIHDDPDSIGAYYEEYVDLKFALSKYEEIIGKYEKARKNKEKELQERLDYEEVLEQENNYGKE